MTQRIVFVLIAVFVLSATVVVGLAQDDPTPTNRDRLAMTATAFAQMPAPTVVPQDTTNDLELTATAIIATATAMADLPATNVPQQEQGRTAPGDVMEQSFRDELSSSRTEVEFPVYFEAGSTARINLSSESFDTYLYVKDTNGREIATDDDGGSGTNSSLIFSASESGTYTLVATSYNVYNQAAEGPTGLFELSVTPFQSQSLPFGTSYGEFSESDIVYTFSAEVGQTFMFGATSDSDTTLTLSLNGYQVDYNDDGGEGLNPLMGPIDIAENGTYTLTLSTYSGEPGGTFELYVGSITPQAVSYDTPFIADPANAFNVFTFNANSGDVFNVSAVGTSGQMILQDSYGYNVAEGNIGNGNAINQHLVGETGTYQLIVSGISDSVAIEIAETELPLLEAGGSVTLDFDDMTSEMAVRLSAFAGEEVEVEVYPVASRGDYWDVTVEVFSDGESVGYYTGSGGTGLSFSTRFNSDGDKVLQVSTYSGEPITVKLNPVANQ